MSADRKETGTSRPTLYLVATPIGNLEDITLRALQVLKQVDCVSCEDTRRTSNLLRHYGICVPLESHHEHNEARSGARLLALLRQGKSVALVTDAGTPGISDPGYALVAACSRAGIAVVPIPGPCAAVAALAASGLPTDSFYFVGFLPPRSAQRRTRLRELASLPCTLILYEAPHRIQGSLADMLEILGPRRACLAREITKMHEEWLRGTLEQILATVRSRAALRGEITLVIDRGEPPPTTVSWPDSLARHLEKEMRETGAPRNEALKTVARQRGISRKEAYRLLLHERDG